MELFLSEYGLSSEEGIALMCLAEALLRVPDTQTIDALIEDKISAGAWGQHLGQSHSSLINASTWGLFLTGKLLDDNEGPSISKVLSATLKRLGEPVVRAATMRAMQEMGRQFVLGETIEEALERASILEEQGFHYSYDMLGEAALTQNDARRYHLAYSDAITEIAKQASSDDIRLNPGISIKLSALHPTYHMLKKERVLTELVPVVHALAMLAKSSKIGLNIDAEEAGRLDLSLMVIEEVLSDPVFAGWDGFGIVVQAYNLRAPEIIDHLYGLANQLDRKIMIRLVKGAYWDSEIKLAQIEGHPEYPVFTHKAATDVSYMCCAEKLLSMTDRIYPQFATHNAHSVAAILKMAADRSKFEFQRLHGMGEALHDNVLKKEHTRCRIYAPVGEHKDLLAYLVRRLLENGANSSFVSQISDKDVPSEIIAQDPFEMIADQKLPKINLPNTLFYPNRENSKGLDLSDQKTLAKLEQDIAKFDEKFWSVTSFKGKPIDVFNPATQDKIGSVNFASSEEAYKAIDETKSWANSMAKDRATILNRAADLYQENAADFYALLMREAGKTLLDCVGELREAVDFLRYYAKEALARPTDPAGIFTCISPWNFPLAIFTGQISAALSVGNGVIAKPAEATSLIAHFAISLLHQAGVPEEVLTLIPGHGYDIGKIVTSHPKINGVCFTGSTQTAQKINREMAEHLNPISTLIAETGGLNAMIVDSTALPEQATQDIVTSAFQSAGQRCSALRILYVQEDIADDLTNMLIGAINELELGNPRQFSSDIGPIINNEAATKIRNYILKAQRQNQLINDVELTEGTNFIPPTMIKINGIEELAEEIFGPVLHIATFKAHEFDAVIEAVNAKGYGLTFGLHSRIDDHVQHVIDHINVGNIYINRNQIGAVVGSQPFGGEGLSGTGPKAGGPKYLDRFLKVTTQTQNRTDGKTVSIKDINKAFNALQLPPQVPQLPHVQNYMPIDLPGPTGESNQYTKVPKKRVLCLGPNPSSAMTQATKARALGCHAIAIAPGVEDGLNGVVSPEVILKIPDIEAVVYWSDDCDHLRRALANREGPIIPLLTERDFTRWLMHERSICIDTTASGGNVELLSS